MTESSYWSLPNERPYLFPLQHSQALEKANTPVFLITGWSDNFLEQTMEQYERLKARGC